MDSKRFAQPPRLMKLLRCSVLETAVVCQLVGRGWHAQRCANMARRCASLASRWANVAPRWSQDEPMRRQEWPMWRQDGPKISQCGAQMRECSSCAGESSILTAPRRHRRPQESTPVVWRRGCGALVKPHFGSRNRALACMGCVSGNPSETHPAEGMTKVIPALSCKHDNCEAHGMRERLSSTPQELQAAWRIQSLRAFRRAGMCRRLVV